MPKIGYFSNRIYINIWVEIQSTPSGRYRDMGGEPGAVIRANSCHSWQKKIDATNYTKRHEGILLCLRIPLRPGIRGKAGGKIPAPDFRTGDQNAFLLQCETFFSPFRLSHAGRPYF